MPSENGWSEWSKHVLIELERLDEGQKMLQTGINEVKIEIAKLKVKAGAWGFAAGLLPALGILLVTLIRNIK